MNYGICDLSVMAMRKEGSHTSEMVSQLLFNDLYVKLDENQEWSLIRAETDGYEGWIPSIQHKSIGKDEFDNLKSAKMFVTDKLTAEHGGKLLSLGTTLFDHEENSREIPARFDPMLMIEYAKLLLDVPYLWGGRSVFGIDCSGLVQLCAHAAGLQLPRNASEQAKMGDVVYFLTETQPGDLAFFGKEDGTITHVGIIIGDEQIIHSSGKVRIDFLDQSGIFNKERNVHSHQLLTVRRLHG